jgi:hypothetical protein
MMGSAGFEPRLASLLPAAFGKRCNDFVKAEPGSVG